MRVNTVDNTNFQMALKLNPKTMPEKLKELPMEDIIRLNQLGEKLKDIKLYDVVLEDNFIPQVKSVDPSIKKDFFKDFKKEEEYLGKPYGVTCEMCGEKVSEYFSNEPKIFREIYKNNASKEYEEFKKLPEIEQAGELSRLLERRDIRKIIEQEVEKAKRKFNRALEEAKKEQSRMVNNLAEKSAEEQPIKPKKKWFLRFWS